MKTNKFILLRAIIAFTLLSPWWTFLFIAYCIFWIFAIIPLLCIWLEKIFTWDLKRCDLPDLAWFIIPLWVFYNIYDYIFNNELTLHG